MKLLYTAFALGALSIDSLRGETWGCEETGASGVDENCFMAALIDPALAFPAGGKVPDLALGANVPDLTGPGGNAPDLAVAGGKVPDLSGAFMFPALIPALGRVPLAIFFGAPPFTGCGGAIDTF